MHSKDRLKEIDVCKGLCVVLVVVGHVFLQSSTNDEMIDNFLTIGGGIIYRFHMELFFYLSGFLASKILNFQTLGEKYAFIKSRSVRLLLPYFSMGIVYIPLRLFLGKYARLPYDFENIWKIFIGENPDSALWFLYALFIITALVTLIIRKNNVVVLTFFAGLLYFISGFVDFSFNPLDWIFRYSFFFLLGILGRCNWKSVSGYLNSDFFLIILVMLFCYLIGSL